MPTWVGGALPPATMNPLPLSTTVKVPLVAVGRVEGETLVRSALVPVGETA